MRNPNTRQSCSRFENVNPKTLVDLAAHHFRKRDSVGTDSEETQQEKVQTKNNNKFNSKLKQTNIHGVLFIKIKSAQFVNKNQPVYNINELTPTTTNNNQQPTSATTTSATATTHTITHTFKHT